MKLTKNTYFPEISSVDVSAVLFAIDKLPEFTLRKIMKPYIDTPGNYREEVHDYLDIHDYYHSNMGAHDYMKLINWIKLHPKASIKIIKLSKGKKLK